MAELIEFHQGSPEWLEARRSGITATDAPALYGVSPWSSPLKVWTEKKAREEYPFEVTPRMLWGQRLEGPMLDAYIEETKLPATHTHGMFRHEGGLLLASPDAEVGEAGLVELKTSQFAEDWFEAGAAEPHVPLHVQFQVRHQMLVTDRLWTDVCILIGGNDFHILPRVWRDEDWDHHHLQVVPEWWAKYVVGDVEPAAQAADESFLKQRYGYEPEKAVELEEKFAHMLDDWTALGNSMRQDVARRDDIVALFRQALGEAAVGILPDGRRVTRTRIEKHDCRYTKKDPTHEVVVSEQFRLNKPRQPRR